MELVLQWLSKGFSREFILRREPSQQEWYLIILKSNTQKVTKYLSTLEMETSRFDLLELTLRKIVFEICPSMKDDEPIV